MRTLQHPMRWLIKLIVSAWSLFYSRQGVCPSGFLSPLQTYGLGALLTVLCVCAAAAAAALLDQRQATVRSLDGQDQAVHHSSAAGPLRSSDKSMSSKSRSKSEQKRNQKCKQSLGKQSPHHWSLLALLRGGNNQPIAHCHSHHCSWIAASLSSPEITQPLRNKRSVWNRSRQIKAEQEHWTAHANERSKCKMSSSCSSTHYITKAWVVHKPTAAFTPCSL